MAVSEILTRLLLRQVKQLIVIIIITITIITEMRKHANLKPIVAVHLNCIHIQANAKQQQHQGGVAITNLITFKCLNIVFCVGENISKIASTLLIQKF